MSAKSSDLDIIGVDVPMTSGYAEKGYTHTRRKSISRAARSVTAISAG